MNRVLHKIVISGILFTISGGFCLSGCGPDAQLKEIHALRKSGQCKDGREKALEILRQETKGRDYWLEFVRCTLDLSRIEERSGADPLPLVIQSAIASAAIYRAEDGSPSAEWRDAGAATSTELTRLANQISGQFRAQVRTAQYLNQMKERPNWDASGDLKALQTMNTIDNYRRDGRDLLYRAIVIEHLFGMLPEAAKGTNATMQNQLSLTKTEWVQWLELGAEYTQPLVERAQVAVESAMDRAAGDIDELGTFLPASILENGIL